MLSHLVVWFYSPIPNFESDMSTENRAKRKFRVVYAEISAIESKIHQTDGFIFVNHRHTVEELLSSRNFQRIDSFTKKLGLIMTTGLNQVRSNKTS